VPFKTKGKMEARRLGLREMRADVSSIQAGQGRPREGALCLLRCAPVPAQTRDAPRLALRATSPHALHLYLYHLNINKHVFKQLIARWGAE